MAQIENPELVRNLASSFHKRSDLALNLAHSISFMQAIPGLVGFWPHGDRDIGGHGLHLVGVSTIITHALDNNVVPYVQYDRSGSAELWHGDNANLSITGTESYVLSGYKGMTMGGWWQVSQAPTVQENLMSKWNVSPNKSWLLYKSATAAAISVALSSDGSTNTNNWNSSIAPPEDEWFYCVMRWVPSTEIKVYYGLATDNDLTTDSTTSSITASIHDASSRFQLGSVDSATDYLDGRSSMSFLIRGKVPDLHIETFFDLTSPLFAAT
jgi:hypothetical protein